MGTVLTLHLVYINFQMNRKRKASGQNETGDAKKFKCDECPKQYVHDKDLKKHIEKKHQPASQRSRRSVSPARQKLTKNADAEQILTVLSCNYSKFQLSKIFNLNSSSYPVIVKDSITRNAKAEEIIKRVLHDGSKHGISEVTVDRHLGNIMIKFT